MALAAIVLIGCEKKVEQKYVARVNDSYLTEENLSFLTDPGKEGYTGKNSEELIRQWIDTEILYQEALKNNKILGAEFNNVIERSTKELAGVLLLKDAVANEKARINEDEIEDFFNSNKTEFVIAHDAAVVNMVKFNDEELAIQFRTELVNKGWNNTSEEYARSSSLLEKQENKLIYKYQIQPLKLMRVIDELLPGEISIIIETEPDVYTIVQLIDFINKGSVPDFEYIKNLVRQRYTIMRNKQFVQNYIQQLRTKYDIEIRRND